MNISINPEDLARINEQLAAEELAKPNNPLDQAFDSAETIRTNIKAIKGDSYLAAVEFGVVINKLVHMNAALSGMLVESEPEAKIPVTLMGRAFSTMMASLLNKHCEALNMKEDNENFAKELTSWIDRVCEAEQSGIKQLVEKMEKGNED